MPGARSTTTRQRPRDARGVPLSGATPSAALAYEQALAASLAWRADTTLQLDAALREAPQFVMAHALRAYQLIASRDPQQHRAARPLLERSPGWRADWHERTHLAAIAAALDDDLVRMRAHLDELLDARPHDLLALQVSQTIDYMVGDSRRMLARVDSVLRRLPAGLPGRASVLAMQAFAGVENAESARAEAAAYSALEIDPRDARAHHAMAHVLEMGNRHGEGVRWMNENREAWAHGTTFATHGSWHLALFHLAGEDAGAALSIYDRHLGGTRSAALADLIDAASLLWRIALRGHDVGARAIELADAWETHIDDRHCSFSDLHAMLAFGLAGDGARADRLERALVHSAAQASRHGATTLELGLPGVRALRAFVRGDASLAMALLASLPPLVHQLGGSHAQRDVVHLTLRAAIERARRPGRHGRSGPQPMAKRQTAHRLERPLWGRVTFGRPNRQGGTGSDIRASSPSSLQSAP